MTGQSTGCSLSVQATAPEGSGLRVALRTAPLRAEVATAGAGFTNAQHDEPSPVGGVRTPCYSPSP